MPELFEAAMIICFGFSWPLSVYKSLKSKTVRGKSLLFECLIWTGYVFGISGKLITHNITYVFIFYVINLIMVSVDLVLYYRNYKLDLLADAAANG